MSQINEEKIELTRQFIRDLSALQDFRYNTLIQQLDLTEKGEEFLFDYVFNSDENTFEEYLKFFNYDGPIYESESAK
jgi:hypothetical protein